MEVNVEPHYYMISNSPYLFARFLITDNEEWEIYSIDKYHDGTVPDFAMDGISFQAAMYSAIERPDHMLSELLMHHETMNLSRKQVSILLHTSLHTDVESRIDYACRNGYKLDSFGTTLDDVYQLMT